MAKKITYLLGAGASANTIPVVAYFPERLLEVRKYLESVLPTASHEIKPAFTIPQDLVGTTNAIILEFNWLISEAENYYTIDTLAKKYYLTKKLSDLKRLKKCLMTYFTLEQYIFIENAKSEKYNFKKTKIEKRYGSFIASIARIKKQTYTDSMHSTINSDEINIELNNYIKILSWNYDLQFELNLQRLYLEKTIHFVQSIFQIFPNKDTYNETNNLRMDLSRFAMVKLNGNAIWNEKEMYQPLVYTRTIFDSHTAVDQNETLAKYFLSEYAKHQSFDEQLKCFNFAWENDKYFKDKYYGHNVNLERAEKIASETEILVVIGYSFPIFNREIDNMLFQKMTNLEKVYIQDKYPERIKSTIVNAFKVLQDTKESKKTKATNDLNGNITTTTEISYVPKVEILLEQYTDQFVIPYELNQ